MIDDLRCCLNWYRESDAQFAHWFHNLGKVCNGSLLAKLDVHLETYNTYMRIMTRYDSFYDKHIILNNV